MGTSSVAVRVSSRSGLSSAISLYEELKRAGASAEVSMTGGSSAIVSVLSQVENSALVRLNGKVQQAHSAIASLRGTSGECSVALTLKGTSKV